MGIREGLTAHGTVWEASKSESRDHDLGDAGRDEGDGNAAGGGAVPQDKGDLIPGLVCIESPW